MVTATVDEEKMKNLMKATLVEVLEERRDLVREIVEEALEDIALARSIDQGLESESVSRSEVFAVL
jgi:hypothetical protein